MPEFGPTIAKNRENKKLRQQRENDSPLQEKDKNTTPESKANQQKHLNDIKKLLKSSNDKNM